MDTNETDASGPEAHVPESAKSRGRMLPASGCRDGEVVRLADLAFPIEAVCTGRAREVAVANSVVRRRTYRTAILKTPRSGPVGVGGRGLAGDVQVDRKHHGGDDQAVHAHFRGTAEKLAHILGHVPGPGFLGENLALAGGSEADVCVGDLFQAGTAVLQVTCPRIPCATLADQLQYRDAVSWVSRQGCTGFYLRVIAAGEVRAGDDLRLLERPAAFATIQFVNRVYYSKERDPADVRRLVALEALPGSWRAKLAYSPSA